MKDLKVLRDRILELLRASQSILLLKLYRDGQGFGDYFVQFGGESTTQVRDRMELTIRAIMESVADGSKSLLVSHGPSILQFCRRVLNPDQIFVVLKIVVSYTLLIIKGNLNWFQYIIL